MVRGSKERLYRCLGITDLLAPVLVRDCNVDAISSLTASEVSSTRQEHPPLALIREVSYCSIDLTKAVFFEAAGPRVRVSMPTPKGATSSPSS